jgi:hypothetical protein
MPLQPEDSVGSQWSIRHASCNEIWALAELYTAAFWNEDFVGRFVHTKKSEYPDDVKYYWYRLLRSCWFDWRTEMLVVEDLQSGQIISSATWARKGPGFRGSGWKYSLSKLRRASIDGSEDFSLTCICQDTSFSPSLRF